MLKTNLLLILIWLAMSIFTYAFLPHYSTPLETHEQYCKEFWYNPEIF